MGEIGDRIEVLVRDDWRCWFCGEHVNQQPRVGYLKGVNRPRPGPNPNLAAMCVRCCSRQGGLSVDEYRDLVQRTSYPEAGLAYRLRRDPATSQLEPAMQQRVATLIAELEQAAPPVVFFGEREDAG